MRRLRLRHGLALSPLFLLLAWGLWEGLTWPDFERLAQENPRSTAFLDHWERAARKTGKPAKAAWQPVPYSRISNELKHAVIVAEDIDFFSHRGFAWDEMKKAVDQAREEGKPLRGASTISQQLVKNLWLSPSRNPWRKVKEALLTRDLEANLSKRRILELYLNVVELGPGVYGAEAASRRYFGHSAANLSRQEAAALAASLTRPTTWHPGVTSRGYQRRIALILRRMERAAWVRGEL
jgi:monofunctional glycosyltransferase